MVHRHLNQSASHRQREAAILSSREVPSVAGCSYAGPFAQNESGAEGSSRRVSTGGAPRMPFRRHLTPVINRVAQSSYAPR